MLQQTKPLSKTFLNSLSSSEINKGNGDIDSFDYGGSSFSAF